MQKIARVFRSHAEAEKSDRFEEAWNTREYGEIDGLESALYFQGTVETQ